MGFPTRAAHTRKGGVDVSGCGSLKPRCQRTPDRSLAPSRCAAGRLCPRRIQPRAHRASRRLPAALSGQRLGADTRARHGLSRARCALLGVEAAARGFCRRSRNRRRLARVDLPRIAQLRQAGQAGDAGRSRQPFRDLESRDLGKTIAAVDGADPAAAGDGRFCSVTASADEAAPAAAAGVHRTVLLREAVDALAIQADGCYVDATFGRGGHSRLILERLGAHGRLIALDKDPQAVAAAAEISDARFSVAHASFEELAGVLARLGLERVDGVLLDLGVSSPQIDDAGRGFSFRRDGPLDMRMDTSRGQTAAQWLETAGEAEIREVIRDYGEERFAKQIAKAIVAARQGGPVVTTGQLADIVGAAVRTREKHKDPA